MKPIISWWVNVTQDQLCSCGAESNSNDKCTAQQSDPVTFISTPQLVTADAGAGQRDSPLSAQPRISTNMVSSLSQRQQRPTCLRKGYTGSAGSSIV